MTKRNIEAELKGLKLNVRISPNTIEKDVMDINLYNHTRFLAYIKFSNSDGFTASDVQFFGNRYEASVFSQSRMSKANTPLDDFDFCLQAIEGKKNIGEVVQITDVTVVQDPYIETPKKTTENDIKLGKFKNWTLYRTVDKSSYYFKYKKEYITATSIQTVIEKFAISAENTGADDIPVIKKALGIDMEFEYDLSKEEREENTIKEIKKIVDSNDAYEDKLGKIAIAAMRELNESQREFIIEKIKDYADDPEKTINEELNVAI